MKLSHEAKGALYQALWTFIGITGLAVLGALTQVASWASTQGKQHIDLGVLGYAVVSAAVAAASGLVSFIVRKGQAKDYLPGNGPVYPTKAAD